jgi:hypothetical protein
MPQVVSREPLTGEEWERKFGDPEEIHSAQEETTASDNNSSSSDNGASLGGIPVGHQASIVRPRTKQRCRFS